MNTGQFLGGVWIRSLDLYPQWWREDNEHEHYIYTDSYRTNGEPSFCDVMAAILHHCAHHTVAKVKG